MDLSNSHNDNDFIDLMNPPHEHRTGFAKKDEIVPSYDFQPIRQQSNLDSGNVGGTRVWNSADSKTHATGIGIRNYSSPDSIEPTKVVLEKDYNTNIAALVSEIDQTMKMHADDLLHALEGVSARISQIESRTRHLENSVDDLKVSVGNNHGSTDVFSARELHTPRLGHVPIHSSLCPVPCRLSGYFRRTNLCQRLCRKTRFQTAQEPGVA